MRHVGVYEAKTQLPRLLDAVEKGETIVITRHGKPVARLVPLTESREGIRETIRAIGRDRKGNRLDGVTIRELIDDGRKY